MNNSNSKTIINFADYEKITGNNDRRHKRNQLNKVMGQSSKAFNLFVLASVDFFYHDGNRQINIINDLLKMAQQCRGMNAGRLAGYLKKVVPHNLKEATSHGEAPKFTTKSDQYLDFSDVQLFIAANPLWYKYGNVDKSTFYTDTYLKAVVTKLKKENVNVKEFALSLLKEGAA